MGLIWSGGSAREQLCCEPVCSQCGYHKPRRCLHSGAAQRETMALLTQSETLAFNGFLSSIDFGDALEWSGYPPDKLPLFPSQGKEAALAKATKDLMSLEGSLRSDDAEHDAQMKQPADIISGSWPSFPGETMHRAQQDYTYGFGVPSSSRNPRRSTLLSEQRRSSQEDIFAAPPASQSPGFFDTPGSSSSSFTTPSEGQSPGSQSGPFAASVPAVVTRSRSGSKRGLPDNDWSGASAKRRRPSLLSEHPASPALDDPSYSAVRSRSARASSVSSTTTVSGTPREGEPGTGTAKPALLSPSQKRANHIQSEQKRRANIRKGYEALCEAVPTLRDAIRVEDERGASEFAIRASASADCADAARAEDDNRKRKKKAKSGEEAEKADGRAGPKSENVVLQKSTHTFSCCSSAVDIHCFALFVPLY